MGNTTVQKGAKRKEGEAHVWAAEYSIDGIWWEYWDARVSKISARVLLNELATKYPTLHRRIAKYIRQSPSKPAKGREV